MDSLTARYLEFLDETHASECYITDMTRLAEALGIEQVMGEFSVCTADGVVQISRWGTTITRRADAAHEIVHALAHRGNFTKKFEKYHASAPDLHAHLELLTEHGADLLLMPDMLVTEVIEQCGVTAQAVWVLSRFADVEPCRALRRLVHWSQPGVSACSGFIAVGSIIQHVETTGYAPFWYGHRLPEPHLVFGDNLSLFKPPNRPSRLIGMLTSPLD